VDNKFFVLDPVTFVVKKTISHPDWELIDFEFDMEMKPSKNLIALHFRSYRRYYIVNLETGHVGVIEIDRRVVNWGFLDTGVDLFFQWDDSCSMYSSRTLDVRYTVTLSLPMVWHRDNSGAIVGINAEKHWIVFIPDQMECSLDLGEFKSEKLVPRYFRHGTLVLASKRKLRVYFFNKITH